MIKFWSYDREYKKYKNSILKNFNKTLKKGNIFFGDQLKIFEKNFKKKYKSKYGIAVGSGKFKTQSLETQEQLYLFIFMVKCVK